MIGATIALISQKYHISGDFDSFLLTWFVLALILPYYLHLIRSQKDRNALRFLHWFIALSLLFNIYHFYKGQKLQYLLHLIFGLLTTSSLIVSR